ncbi:MAG TPA: ASKHA domain-containing protein [Bacteroidales bacterium]|nr:ASKHA domain-containing protein [Bacteroidales bacterium]
MLRPPPLGNVDFSNISCGMGAVSGAISVFSNPGKYQVIGNSKPLGICGSGIVDIIAYLLVNDLIDETGLLKEPFIISAEKNIQIVQQDIREIQLAKSAIYSGVKILMNIAGLTFSDIDAVFLAGGFGNYINIKSATLIGLLPHELRDKIYPVGNSAGIGALQYLKSNDFEEKTVKILKDTGYIELSNIDEFTMEFALNMDFKKHSL